MVHLTGALGEGMQLHRTSKKLAETEQMAFTLT